jgi:hypothetical protein
MAAVVAHVFRVCAAPSQKSDAVSGQDTDERMSDLFRLRLLFEKAVSAVTGKFNQPIALSDFFDSVPEKPAQIPDLFGEPRPFRESITHCGKHQRVATAHADVLVNAVAIRQTDICVVSEKAGERVPDVGARAVLIEVPQPALATAASSIAVMAKDLVIDHVTPESAAQAHTSAPYSVMRQGRASRVTVGPQSNAGRTPV